MRRSMRAAQVWSASVLSGLVIAMLLTIVSTPVSAGMIEIWAQEDSGPTVLLGSGPSPVPGLTIIPSIVLGGDFSITVLAAQAVMGATSQLLDTSLNITNNDLNGTHTLSLFVVANDFITPAGTATLNSSSAGNYGSGTGSVTFQAWENNANSLTLQSGTFTNGLQTASPASGTNTSFDTGAVNSAISTTAPFALNDVTRVTLTGGGNLSFSSHVAVTQAVPEPATLLLLGGGLAGIGIWRRKAARV